LPVLGAECRVRCLVPRAVHGASCPVWWSRCMCDGTWSPGQRRKHPAPSTAP